MILLYIQHSSLELVDTTFKHARISIDSSKIMSGFKDGRVFHCFAGLGPSCSLVLLCFVLVLPQIVKLIARERTMNFYRLMHLAGRGRIDAERTKREKINLIYFLTRTAKKNGGMKNNSCNILGLQYMLKSLSTLIKIDFDRNTVSLKD